MTWEEAVAEAAKVLNDMPAKESNKLNAGVTTYGAWVSGYATALMDRPDREEIASFLRAHVQTLDKDEEWHLADALLASKFYGGQPDGWPENETAEIDYNTVKLPTYKPDARGCAEGHKFSSEADCVLPEGWDYFFCRKCLNEYVRRQG